MDDQQRYDWARDRVQQLRHLYAHAAIFVFVNLWLLVINLVTNAQSLWFYWPLIGWSIVLAAHAFIVFGAGSGMARNWEHRKIHQLMSREMERETTVHHS